MMMMIFITLSLTMTSNWWATILTLPIIMVIVSLKLFNPITSEISCNFFMTLDSMSVLLIMLTLWITNLMLMTSMKIYYFNKKKDRFISSTLVLAVILIIAFSTNMIWMFYIMFEASLVPTLIIILTWGYQPERVQAGMYLMLYTVTASMPLLVALVMVTQEPGNGCFFFNPPKQPYIFLSWESGIWYAALTLAFLVKMPMYMSHLWLPKAHVEAPVAGSMILASILLKLGGYGLLRVMSCWPCLAKMAYFVIPVSVTGAMLTAIMCIRQTDMKAMIAYSSVSHMAMVITGIFTMNKWGWEGSLVMMIAHGLISSGLFTLANMYYENSLSRSLMINTGMMMISPSMALWWFLMIAGNMGAPPFINLLGEIMLISSATAYALATPVFLIMCSFFTVCYSMVLYTSLHHGPTLKSTNFFKILPTYYSIAFFHLIPALTLIISSSNLLWL